MERLAFALVVVSLGAACAREDIEHGDGGATHADGGAALEVYARGDLATRTFTDGLAGQTPTALTLGLGRFDLLRSATDPSPVTLLDLGAAPAEVDLRGGEAVRIGRVPLASLPSGTFTHGRALLTYARCAVAATIHSGAMALGGSLTIEGALSDGTIDGGAVRAGDATYRFAAVGFSASRAGTLPDLPSTGGGTIVREGGRTWLVFALPAPVTLGPTTDAGIGAATIVYSIYEAFRWSDQDGGGYAAGAFDVEASGAFEPVRSFGATDYRLELR